MIGQKITGVILAGGKNSRMGTDKGLLEVEGRRIIDRIISSLQPEVDQIIIISNGDNYEYLGYEVYSDIVKDCGPMGGIYTALSMSPSEKNIILSCDMPFITKEAIQYILEDSDDCDIVIPECYGNFEPLCAMYAKTCRNTFHQLLARGEWKLKDALKYFQIKKVECNDLLNADIVFSNINTRKEYQNITENIYEHNN